MKRIVVITVGKTHSGKSTFAQVLEKMLPNSLVIDQDNHAEFINTYYKSLLPKQGPNTIKYDITQTIVDYAIEQTNFHLIVCNSNLARKGRLNLIRYYEEKGFISILVNFDIPKQILQERIAQSKRSTTIFRSASTFEEVLSRQNAESHTSDVITPTEDEADYLFEIKKSDDVQSVSQKIVTIAQSLVDMSV